MTCSFFAERTLRKVERMDGETGCNLFMRSWMVFFFFFVAVRRTKLDVKPRNDRLHH